MTDNLTLIISAIFLLIVIQCGGYISELLTCKLQLILTTNMAYKHIVLFIVILTVLMLGDSNYETNPLQHMQFTSLIYITFLLFIKMNLKFTLATIFVLLLLFILTHYIEYLKQIKDETNETNETNEKKEFINYLSNFKNTFIYAVILLIFGGFIKYFSEKRVEYAKNWSTFNFIFGVNKCKSLENI